MGLSSGTGLEKATKAFLLHSRVPGAQSPPHLHLLKWRKFGRTRAPLQRHCFGIILNGAGAHAGGGMEHINTWSRAVKIPSFSRTRV